MAVTFFGVRHHSPGAARLVAQLIRDHRPAAVLIEGPSDFNGRLDELTLDHQLPIMIYQWAPAFPDAPEGSPEAVARRAAYYPLTDYSPEWTALRAAREIGAEFAFIDLPWLGLIDADEATNRFAEPEPESIGDGLAALYHATGVESVDAMIDELIEIDPDLTVEDYLARMEVVGEVLRGPVDDETRRREEHMAARIREVAARGGDVLVVCGAAHLKGLRELLAAGAVEASPPPSPPADDERYGSALTPTSYAALDALDGYNAGQPNPGFYDAVFRDRARGRADTAERLLAEVAAGLRQRRQSVSAADLIATSVTMRGLADLRGHRHPWRTDLLDGVVGALVKDDGGAEHPLVAAVHDVLRGDRLGVLAPETPRPPLVRELVADLTALELLPTPKARRLEVDLTTPEGLARSRLLHCLVELGIAGFDELVPLTDRGTEAWRIGWQPAYEGTLVAAARFGGSRAEAVSAQLLALATDADRDPRHAAGLLLRAAQCGVADLSDRFRRATQELIAASGDLAAVGEALAVLMRLYRYDPLLGVDGGADLGRVVAAAFDRVLRLTERLAPVAPGVGLVGLVGALQAATDTAERVGGTLGLDLAGWDAALAGVVGDDRQAPELRGAALGARWLTGALPDEALADSLGLAANPADLGDLLAGLLGVAREAALRRRDLLLRLDALIKALSEEDFFAAVPGLRRAFRGYTSRERSQVADTILGREAASALVRFGTEADVAVEIARFEAEVFEVMERFLGGVDG